MLLVQMVVIYNEYNGYLTQYNTTDSAIFYFTSVIYESNN